MDEYTTFIEALRLINKIWVQGGEKLRDPKYWKCYKDIILNYYPEELDSDVNGVPVSAPDFENLVVKIIIKQKYIIIRRRGGGSCG